MIVELGKVSAETQGSGTNHFEIVLGRCTNVPNGPSTDLSCKNG